MIEYDIAVIGAGPGGYVAAIRGAQRGAKVCLIEKGAVGGTCLNRGCIPTKALYATASMLRSLKESAGDHGIEIGSLEFDFPRAMQRKSGVVGKLVGGIEQLLKGQGVELFRGEASLEGSGRIRIRRPDLVGHIRAKNIILATGSVPMRPEGLFAAGENILTSDEILDMKELPERMLVIGGGYIGCEFAGIFATFGSKVCLIEQQPSLLGRSDSQAVREVERAFKDMGVEVLLKTSVESLEPSDGAVRVRLEGGRELEVDKVLVAVGRLPNSSGLSLDAAGVDTDDRGAVKVDEQLRTSAEGIYAIGDLTGGILLAHVASYQASVAVDNALGGDRKVDYSRVPSAVFTFPELAEVGLTEARAKEKGIGVEVGRFSYQASSKALCLGETRGLVKILTSKEDGTILGASIVGAEASSLIAEISVAMKAGLSARELAETIHAHPTLPEILMEAAEDVEGRSVHKVGRKRPSDKR